MYLSKCIRNLTGQRSFYFSAYQLQAKADLDIEKIEQESVELDVVDEEAQQREAEIEKKRNKSRLYPSHRNMVHDQPPYTTPKLWIHGTLRFQRKLYAKYGDASGVNPALCFPTKEELEETREYEAVAYPFTIPEMVEKSKQVRLAKEERIRKRQEDIVQKVKKLDAWTKEITDKVLRKEQEAKEIKDKKDRLIEEVRRHFGYAVDPRDEKFKELLEKKEKEQKKAAKEARKKMKEEKLMTKLLQKEAQDSEESKPKET